MFCFYLTLTLIQLAFIICFCIDSSFAKQPLLSGKNVGLVSFALLMFLTGAFQEWEGSGPYGDPSKWVLTIFWMLAGISFILTTKNQPKP